MPDELTLAPLQPEPADATIERAADALGIEPITPSLSDQLTEMTERALNAEEELSEAWLMIADLQGHVAAMRGRITAAGDPNDGSTGPVRRVVA